MPKQTEGRIHKIIALIRRKGGVSKEFLLKELEVSAATIKRDFEFLKDRLHCPLEYDRSKGGYVIRDDQLPNGTRFELPGIWFDSSEVYALLTMLHLLEGVQPGLLNEHVAPLKVRLREMLSQGAHSAKEIERRVKLIHFANRRVDSKHFQLLAGALLDRKRLRLSYWVRERGEETKREVSPLQLVHYRENWLLDAWCHERKALRSFSLEAIRSVEVLGQAAKEVSEQDLADHFQSGYGIFAGKASAVARLKFSPKRAQWVSLETWHEKQATQWLPDGSYLLEVPYSNDQELVMDLLRHGAEVEVLAPPELRQRLAAELCAAAEKYRAQAV